MSEEYIVVLPIEEIHAGEAYEQGQPVPLHCTLMHWFVFDDDFSSRRVGDTLEILCAKLGQETIKLVAEARALFGPQDNVPVSVLARNPDLNFLHTSLLIELSKERVKFQELRWIGAGYRAHVADVGGRAFAPGSTHKANRLTLVSRGEDKKKKALRQYRLGKWAY